MRRNPFPEYDPRLLISPKQVPKIAQKRAKVSNSNVSRGVDIGF
jgi:hypothetical protein